MIFTRPFRLLALFLCCAALPASNALAGKKASSRPSVSSLAPLTLRVGDTLTIRGHDFLPGKKRNSVAFKHDGSPAVTVKASDATRTRLKVVVPPTLAKYFTVAGGVAQPSRFRVRVVAGGSSSKGYTALKRSPVIAPPHGAAGGLEIGGPGDAGCDTDAVVVDVDVEGDDGTLAGDVQAATEPDTCSVDTVGDGLYDDGQ